MQTPALVTAHFDVRLASIRVLLDGLLSALRATDGRWVELEDATHVYREAVMKAQDRP
jgi:hypothetical protein